MLSFLRRLVVRLAGLWWWFVLLAGLSAVALGAWGFVVYYAARPDLPQPGLLDILYRCVQMFFLSWEGVPGPLPWQLEVARFLAAFVAVSTVIAALGQLFHDQFQRHRLASFRDHVVVCGLGAGGVGLVADLRARGQEVVVIESRADHPDLERCREQDAVVVVGSPADPWALSRAGVQHAAQLLSLSQEDSVSVEALMQAHHLCLGRTAGPLHCVVQVFDQAMQRLLRDHTAFKGPQSPVRLELFNLFDLAAQVMCLEGPAFYAQRPPQKLVIVGAGGLGQSLLARLARSWWVDELARQQDNRQAAPPRREVVLLDPLATPGGELHRRVEELLGGISGQILGNMCRLVPVPMDAEAPEFAHGKFLPEGWTTFDAAWVCVPDDRLAVLSASRLWERYHRPLVVRMSSLAGFATLLTALAEKDRQAADNLHVVGLRELANTIDLLTMAPLEMLAREHHLAYVQDQLSRVAGADKSPAVVPWHRLPAELREPNRRAAADVDAKLQALGYVKVPAFKIDRVHRFDDREVEALARMEHERWLKEREEQGWRHGPKRDDALKTTPHLLPYDDLPSEVKETSRAQVRCIPTWLARAGFALQRKAQEAGPPTAAG